MTPILLTFGHMSRDRFTPFTYFIDNRVLKGTSASVRPGRIEVRTAEYDSGCSFDPVGSGEAREHILFLNEVDNDGSSGLVHRFKAAALASDKLEQVVARLVRLSGVAEVEREKDGEGRNGPELTDFGGEFNRQTLRPEFVLILALDLCAVRKCLSDVGKSWVIFLFVSRVWTSLRLRLPTAQSAKNMTDLILSLIDILSLLQCVQESLS